MNLTTLAAEPEQIGGIPGMALDLIDTFGAPGGALFVMLDVFIPGFPGELMLPMIGFSASQGLFSLPSALIWTTAGSVVGALLLYLIGVLLGRDRTRRLMDRVPLMKATDFDRTEAWFHRHGKKAVFFGRMVPFFRSVISLPAGIERMSLWQYIALSAAGSFIWNSVLASAGYALGANWERVEQYIGIFQTVVVIALVAFVGYFVVSRVRKAKRRA